VAFVVRTKKKDKYKSCDLQ